MNVCGQQREDDLRPRRKTAYLPYGNDMICVFGDNSVVGDGGRGGGDGSVTVLLMILTVGYALK